MLLPENYITQHDSAHQLYFLSGIMKGAACARHFTKSLPKVKLLRGKELRIKESMTEIPAAVRLPAMRIISGKVETHGINPHIIRTFYMRLI